MVEFLTENAFIAYPLADTMPAGVDVLWTRALLDAAIGHTTNDIPVLETVGVASGSAEFTISVGGSRITVAATRGLSKFATVYAKNDTTCALITVDGSAINTLIDKAPGAITVGRAFCMRCCSGFMDGVLSVDAYSPDIGGELFSSEPRTPVISANNDIVLVSKDGVDIDTTFVDALSDDVLRISAIAATQDYGEADEVDDIMIRGDDCYAVETIPHAYAVGNGAIVSTTDSKGVIRITSKCKPCCQCEDYKDAYDELKPLNDTVFALRDVLDEAKLVYDTARKAFEDSKITKLDSINSPDNIHISASVTTSNGDYKASTENGRRSRFAVSVTVINMSRKNVDLGSLTVAPIPDYYELIRTTWSRSGDENTPNVGNVATKWTLVPGGSITIVRVYAKLSETNTVKLSDITGMAATISVTVRKENGAQVTTMRSARIEA